VRAGEREDEQARELSPHLLDEARVGGRPLVGDEGAVDEEERVSSRFPVRLGDAHGLRPGIGRS
jgi:hypothetical protein